VTIGSDPAPPSVSVAWGAPDAAVCVEVAFVPGATVRSSIERSGLLQRFPGIDLAVNRVGIWGRVCSADAPVGPGDRIEIYQPLRIDPRESRRRRAAVRAARGAR
jgi:hypothetical protein